MPQESPGSASPVPRTGLHKLCRGSLVRALVKKLRQLGLQPRLVPCDQGVMAGGAPYSLSLSEMAEAPDLAAQLLARLRRTLMQRVPVTLTLHDAGARGPVAIEAVCSRLNAMLSAPCLDRRHLGVAVHARDMQWPVFRQISRVLLGNGSRYLYLDETHLQAESGADSDTVNAAIWSGLYLQRNRASRILPVYGGGVRTRCPLLGDEATGALLPQRSVLVPPDSAWLPLDLFLCRYANAHGTLREAELCDALARGLILADRLFDQLDWPDRAQKNDAYLNRRIAIILHGIGDLTALRGISPANLDCLRSWDRLLGRIHQCLWDQSRDLAAARGLLPALAIRNPSEQWSGAAHRNDWHKRWHEALKTDAVRHRNLLVLSPYSVLPRSGTSRAAYTDLLPLLAHADACSFAGAPSFTRWSISEFKHFHRRAYAIMQRRNAASFVAAGA